MLERRYRVKQVEVEVRLCDEETLILSFKAGGAQEMQGMPPLIGQLSRNKGLFLEHPSHSRWKEIRTSLELHHEFANAGPVLYPMMSMQGLDRSGGKTPDWTAFLHFISSYSYFLLQL